jgi:hypothetical protein
VSAISHVGTWMVPFSLAHHPTVPLRPGKGTVQPYEPPYEPPGAQLGAAWRQSLDS